MKNLSKQKILSAVFTVLLLAVALLGCLTLAGCKKSSSNEPKETALFISSSGLESIIKSVITVDEGEYAVGEVKKVGFYLEKNVPSGFIYSEKLTTLYDSILEEDEQTSKMGMVKVYSNDANTEFAFASQYKIEACENCYGLFRNFTALTEIDFGNFYTTNVTSMSSMFAGCYSLTSLNLSTFNTSNVTSMSKMFYSCSSLNNIYGIGGFDTSNVINMSQMFWNCQLLNNLDGISAFNTSKVKDMSKMFYGCSNLTTLNISNFDTRQISSALKFSSMFTGTFGKHYNDEKAKLILGANFKIGLLEINSENLYNNTGLSKVVPFEIR